jgi:hypothetical protein
MTSLAAGAAGAAVSAARAVTCEGDFDCSLNGACSNGTCLCDHAWKGKQCGQLDLCGSSPAVRLREAWTWGGSPIQDAENHVINLFFSELTEGCGLLHYQTNSVVRRAQRDPAGGWSVQEVVLGPRPGAWDSGGIHAPTIRYHRQSRTYLLFYEATHYPAGPLNCTMNASVPSVYVSKTRRIGVAFSPSPSGPWRRLKQPILSPSPAPAWDSDDVSNAAPHVFANGSVLLCYRAGGNSVAMGGGIGCARADHWRGPYSRIGPSRSRPLFAAEDATIWQTARGLHMLVHRFANGSNTTGNAVGGLAYSADGLEWEYAASPAYTTSVRWSNGSFAMLYRRERPQLLLDASGAEIEGLFNGAWPCHFGDDDEDAHDAARGCSSFTMSTAIRSQFDLRYGTCSEAGRRR